MVDLSEFPIVISLPLQWGDQDAFGHVNNTVYLRWSETARVVYLARVGLPMPSADAVGPILASICCDYRLPLTYPDTVRVGARVAEIGNSSFRMLHHIVSASQDAVAAEVESTMVLFDYKLGRSIRVPDEMRAAIEQLERGGNGSR